MTAEPITAAFTQSGPLPVTVTVETGEDTDVVFGCASGRAVCPPEIEYPVTWFYVTVHAPFVVELCDLDVTGDALTCYLANPAVDDDYADVPVKLDLPYTGETHWQIEQAAGTEVIAQVFLHGDAPVGYTGAAYERSAWR